MSTQDFTLKRYSGSEWVTLYPETIPSQVTGLLDSNTKKISLSYIPDSLFGGMTYCGSLDAPGSGSAAAVFINTILDGEDSTYYTSISSSKKAKGRYLIMSESITLPGPTDSFTLTVDNATKYAKLSYNGEYMDDNDSNSIILETGDWLLFDGLKSGSGTSSDPYIYSVSIVNNTYQTASGTAFGVVKLANTNSLTTAMTGVVPTASEVVSYINGKNYTTNTGTVTSVTLSAGTGISLDSTGAITTSGTRTISLASGVCTAGTYRSVTVDTYGRVTSGTNPTTLSGYGITDAKISGNTITLGSNSITAITDISGKANIANPTFTGTVTVPTLNVTTAMNMSTSTFGTTKGHLQYAADGKISIDTATYATTTQLAAKADIASPTFTGTVTIPTLTITDSIGINSANLGGPGLLKLTEAGGVTVDTTSYLSTSGTAAAASKLSNTSAIGSATTPVYFTSSGVPSAVTSIAVGLIAAASNSANGLLTSTQNKLLTGLATMSSTAPSSPATGEIYFAI